MSDTSFLFLAVVVLTIHAIARSMALHTAQRQLRDLTDYVTKLEKRERERWKSVTRSRSI